MTEQKTPDLPQSIFANESKSIFINTVNIIRSILRNTTFKQKCSDDDSIKLENLLCSVSNGKIPQPEIIDAISKLMVGFYNSDTELSKLFNSLRHTLEALSQRRFIYIQMISEWQISISKRCKTLLELQVPTISDELKTRIESIMKIQISDISSISGIRNILANTQNDPLIQELCKAYIDECF